jgi:hypothetical protein
MRARKSVPSLLSILAAATMTLTLGAAPARAATVEQSDPSGDAAARFDIVDVTYANTTAAFTYRMEFRDLRARTGVLAFPKLLVNGSWSRFFQVNVGVRRDGNRFHRLIINTPRRYETVPCPGLTSTVDLDADVVTARVPQACLARAGFGRQRYLVHGYAATPGMSEAGDSVRRRWVAYD